MELVRHLRKHPHMVVWRLVQCFFCWGQPKPRGTLAHVDCICTQECTVLPANRISQTDASIARLAATIHASRGGIPILSQGEVAEALRRANVPVYMSIPRQVVHGVQQGGYINSRNVADAQKRAMSAANLRYPVLLGYIHHIWRMMWCYEGAGVHDFVIPGDLPRLQYHPDSLQRRWSSQWRAYPYELLARLVFWYHGWTLPPL